MTTQTSLKIQNHIQYVFVLQILKGNVEKEHKIPLGKEPIHLDIKSKYTVKLQSVSWNDVEIIFNGKISILTGQGELIYPLNFEDCERGTISLEWGHPYSEIVNITYVTS